VSLLTRLVTVVTARMASDVRSMLANGYSVRDPRTGWARPWPSLLLSSLNYPHMYLTRQTRLRSVHFREGVWEETLPKRLTMLHVLALGLEANGLAACTNSPA